MSENRKKLVELAFKKMDKNGNGVITVSLCHYLECEFLAYAFKFHSVISSEINYNPFEAL